MWNPLTSILKFGARKISDSSYNKEEKKVQSKTYAQVGKQLRDAKSKGKRINASEAYQNKYDRNMRPVNQKKTRRDKFIDEI